MSKYEKVDCHSHFVPPEYYQALHDHGHKNPDGMPAVPSWTEESHLHMMKSVNVSKSILSITSPGVHLKAGDDALARKLARYVNDYAADLKKRKPDQFGFFASLPIPDVEGSLEEITRAFDELNADGVTVETNHHGTYLGDKKLDPVFDELNRRKAIVFIHPTSPCMPNGDVAVPLTLFPRPTYEFLFDTARAVINLFASGTVSRCPDITFLISHLGGCLPPLINRFSNIAPILGLPGIDPQLNPNFVKERLRTQFYFDTAGWAFTEQIRGLLQYVTVDRILYGSDFPFTPLQAVINLSKEHDQYLAEVFPEKKEQEALCKLNAARLLTKPAK